MAKEITRVTGPYKYVSGACAGRAYMQVYYADGTKGTILYSRWLMEQHLDRRLEPWEIVDHKDEDYTNDALDNLQVTTNEENARKSARARDLHVTYVTFNCIRCGQEGTQNARNYRHNRKQGKAGPFCGKICAGRYGRELQTSRGGVIGNRA